MGFLLRGSGAGAESPGITRATDEYDETLSAAVIAAGQLRTDDAREGFLNR